MALCCRAGVPGKSPKEAIAESSAQLQQGTLSVLEIPVPWNDHQDRQQQWSGGSQSLRDKLCALQRVGLEKNTEDHSESQTTGQGVAYTVGVWFDFVQTVTVPWFLENI